MHSPQYPIHWQYDHFNVDNKIKSWEELDKLK